MNGKVLVLPVLLAVTLVFTACGSGYDNPPGTTTGNLTVQMVQSPPAVVTAGGTANLAANVLNDKANAGVTWSCAPANACGSFSPATTGYQITTVYTAPVAPANGPITTNLAYPVTITATSVTDSSQNVSTTINVAQKYAFVMAGYASFGMVGSVTLDGFGNVIAGETDYSANPNQVGSFPITGTYTLDATTGYGTMTWSITGCCSQANAITATSNSHLTIAEVDQFAGLTFGGIGSMDLQAVGPGPSFSGSQVSGGYSFTLAGYDGAKGFNGSWGGVFTADGTATPGTPGNITGGIFDTSLGGGASGYSSTPFTGTYTAPDANGRGIMDLSNGASYVYYIVTPEVLRLTTTDDAKNTSDVGSAANTGSAFGQGALSSGATNGALNGSFIFSDAGFSSDNNGGEQGAAAGQFTTDGNGNIKTGTGIMDINALGVVSTVSLDGSTYAFSGSPRGTFTGPAGQAYYIYLTDPNLNLLDPNNTSGTGGGLLLEADTADTIGVVIPQTDATASLAGNYAFVFSNQANPPNADGGFDGQFTAPTSSAAGTFSGQGAYQTSVVNGNNTLIPIVGPVSGTFAADGAHPGRYTGAITTTPDLWSPSIGDTTAGTENVSYYLANGTQGFVVETDSLAPAVGAVELQTGVTGAAAAKRPQAQQQQHSHPKNLLQITGEHHGQTSGQAGSGHE
jgi:hypothetical protein